MIAKVIWNIMKSGSGMDCPSSGAAVTPPAKDFAKPPMMPPSPGPEGEGIAAGEPDEAHQRGDRHALHQHREQVLRLNQAAIEQGEARQGHEQDECRRRQDPGRVTRIGRHVGKGRRRKCRAQQREHAEACRNCLEPQCQLPHLSSRA
jgi:hypothetical protein